LSSWTDPFILNNGWLVGLSDLDTESDYVRQRIAAYMTDLIGIGFSGFKMDAAKHIYPGSIDAILIIFKDNLGCKIIIFANKMSAAGLSQSDIMKVKI